MASAAAVDRALGVDYGRRQIGLAVSTMGIAPRPLPPLANDGINTQLTSARAIVDQARAQGAAARPPTVGSEPRAMLCSRDSVHSCGAV